MLLSSSVFAQECSHTYTAGEFMNLAQEKEIHFEIKENEIAAMDGYITDAAKIYNPDIEHFTTTGDQYGQNNVTSETRIWFNLQIANKRQKRADVFRVQNEINAIELQALKMKLRKELFLGILRYKQIEKQVSSVSDLKEVIDGFITRYEKISYLSPEQKVEKGSLEISQNDLILVEAKLINERELIKRFFQRALRENCEVSMTIAGPIPGNSWPEMDEIELIENVSLDFKISQLAIRKSEFEFVREEAKKYPDLKVGPVWQLNKLGNQEFSTYGLSFILPLPLFDVNQGLRSVAEFNLRRSKLEADFSKQQIAKEFDFRKQNYIRLKNKFNSVNEITKYRSLLTEYRALFKRGLISISAFLSYKREFLNLTSEVHDIESALADHLIELHHINSLSTEKIIPKVLNL